MTPELTDLSVLSRRRSGGDGESQSPVPSIPAPRRRWKTRLALPGGILVTATVTVLYAAGDTLRPGLAVRVIPVIVKSAATVALGQVVAQAPGWVEADPFPIAVSALADGVVADVFVLEGESVQAGQVVARLVPDDARLALSRGEAELAQRQAELAAAEAALAAAQTNWDNPIELERKLATAEAAKAEKQAELDRWPAELAAEAALAVYYEAELRRVTPLHNNGQASDIEFIQVRQRHEQQQAIVAAMRARRPMLEAQLAALEAEVAAARAALRLRVEDKRALQEARAAVEQARARVAAAEAARDEAALRLSRMEVRSPADGIVMNRLVSPGAKLMLGGDNPQSAQVLRLYDPRRLQVRVDVPLTDAAKVGVGQPAEVIVEVLPDRVFRGRVTRIVNEADIQKNTLQVKVAIEDPSPEIKPEMLARARFFSVATTDEGQASERIFVPESLLHRAGGEQAHVWIADQARQVAVMRTVTLGRGRSEGWIEVLDGLLPGDRLIADPPAGLRDGRRLRMVGEAEVTGGTRGGGARHGSH